MPLGPAAWNGPGDDRGKDAGGVLFKGRPEAASAAMRPLSKPLPLFVPMAHAALARSPQWAASDASPSLVHPLQRGWAATAPAGSAASPSRQLTTVRSAGLARSTLPRPLATAPPSARAIGDSPTALGGAPDPPPPEAHALLPTMTHIPFKVRRLRAPSPPLSPSPVANLPFFWNAALVAALLLPLVCAPLLKSVCVSYVYALHVYAVSCAVV